MLVSASLCFAKGKLKITNWLDTRTVTTAASGQSDKNEFLLWAWHCQFLIPTRDFQHLIKFRKLPERDS